MLVLEHLVSGQPGRGGRRPGPFHPPHRLVAGPEESGRTLHGRGAETLDGLLLRYAMVVDMCVQQGQLVDTQPFPAGLGRFADHLGRQTLRVVDEAGTGSQGTGTEPGGDDDLVTDAPAAPPPAQDVLAVTALSPVGPEGVVVGRVDEVPARFDVAVEKGERGLLVGERTEQHRAEREHAHLTPVGGVGAYGAVFHGCPPLRSGGPGSMGSLRGEVRSRSSVPGLSGGEVPGRPGGGRQPAAGNGLTKVRPRHRRSARVRCG